MPLQNFNKNDSSSTPVDPNEEQIDSIKRTAHLLASDSVDEVSKSSEKVRRIKSTHYKTLKRGMDEVSIKHQQVFKGMIRRLAVEKLCKKEIGDCLTKVLKEMHSDNHYNWGRIVTAYAFARNVAKVLADCGKPDCVAETASTVGSFISENVSSWIHEQGGWDAFEQFFSEKSPESSMWQGLIYTFLGLGALALTLKS